MRQVIWLVVFVAMGGCGETGVAPVVDAGPPPAAHHGRHFPPPRLPPMRQAAADSRSPAELAQAACMGAAGWRCPSIPRAHMMAASTSSVTPPSWTVSTWAVDSPNVTHCASDANNCSSSTCGGFGVGPCLSYAEIVRRWGTPLPTLNQATRIVFLGDDTEAPFDVTPNLGPSGSLVFTGSLTVVTSGTVGTVVAKNRSTGQRLTANLGQTATGFVGLIFSDTTRSTYAWVDIATSGSVATLSEPFTHPPDCSSLPTPQDTVQAGDAYQILRPSQAPLRRFDPSQQANVFGAPSATCLEHVWVPDPNPSPGMNVFDLGLSATVNETRVDLAAFGRTQNDNQEPVYGFNNYWTSGVNTNVNGQFGISIIGGDVGASSNVDLASNGSFILDGDVIAHGAYLLSNSGGGFGSAYFDGLIALDSNCVAELVANVSGTAALWGPGALSVGPNSTLLLERTSATASLLNSGGISFGILSTITTGCAIDNGVDPAVWHCGRTLTPGHIDGTIVSGGFNGSAVDPFLHAAFTIEK